MLSPIAAAGSAGVRALVQAADPVEALLDTPDDHLTGGSVHHAVAPAVDTSPFAPPGAQLALLATQMPTGLAVAATTAPPSPAAATSPAPTASPQEIAALELMLADPLHRELLANYAPPPQALGATGLAPDLVARYGADLASRLDQLGRAQAAVRDDFLRALDGAHSSPPGGLPSSLPSGPGWVASTVFAVPEDGGPQTVWSFDPDRFAAAYAQGTSLAQRAFAAQCTSLLGRGSAPASTTVAAHESADAATTRVAGHFTLTGGGWSESGSKNGPGQRSWQAHGLVNDGALAVLDPARPPELHQREAVWFDTALGWVTARENIVVKDGFLDKLAKVSFGVAAAWMVGRLDFLAFGPGTAGQIASHAAVGATTAAVTQLAFTGRLDFGGLLRTALTSGLTAGLAQVPQLQPWLATQTGLGLDPARLIGRAGLQGLLQEATGGRFADGALASVANSLAASVGDTLSQGIDARVQAGELSPAEASAWRLMSQAARSAMAALGHPGDPMAGFAQDYLGGLLAAAEVPVGHAAGPEEVQASGQALGRGPAETASDAGRTHPTTSANVGGASGSWDGIEPIDYSVASGGPVRLGTGSAEKPPTPAELQAAFRQSERDDRSSTEQSVAGRAYVARNHDSISRIVGSSSAQAIGNFMRANNLTSDRIELGRTYFVPNDVTAYGDAAAMGQFALNQGNERIAAASAASLIAADGMRIGPTVERAQALGIYSGDGTMPVAAGGVSPEVRAPAFSARQTAVEWVSSMIGTSRAGNVVAGAVDTWLAVPDALLNLPGTMDAIPSGVVRLANGAVSAATQLWSDPWDTVADTVASGVDGLRSGFHRTVNGDGRAMGSALVALSAAGVPLGRVDRITSSIDFVEGSGRLGGELYGVERLRQLGAHLERRGISLQVGDEHLPPGYAGGFSASERTLVLRSNPTNYEVWHELTHYQQFRQLGAEAYSAQTRQMKEQYVFDKLESMPRRWNSLTSDEIGHARWYIDHVGGLW